MNPYLITFLSSLALNVLLFIWWRCARKDAIEWRWRMKEWEKTADYWEERHECQMSMNDGLRKEFVVLTTEKGEKP